MSLKLDDIVGNIFHTEEKQKAQQNASIEELSKRFSTTQGRNNEILNKRNNALNPFVRRDGTLVNPYLDYQGLLDSNSVGSKVKSFITKATGLTPTVKQTSYNGGNTAINSVRNFNISKKAISDGGNSESYSVGTGDFKDKVGQRITDTSKYNNGAAKGQCVWYALGRASERNGKNITIGGNGNSMFYQAQDNAKLNPTANNLKGNTLLCYNKGTSSAGQKYGHVIFIEDVVGDTVYYTEGGSGYYKNGTDGVVKTATKEQILNGVNSAGSRIGSEPLGLIDLSKY